MNVLEGSRRMQQAGRWLIAIPISAMLLIVIIELISGLVRDRGLADLGSFGFPFVGLVLPLAVPGLALWVAGWIVEGFQKDAH